MDVKVSVVVPVYNTEEYLNQCVDSLINQTLKEVEFIFVDDGSTDRSVQILEDYHKKDARIQILKQKNQYAGVARNNGMTHATGKYIIFLDSDDFFDLHMLEKMYVAAEESHADITFCGFWLYDSQTKETKEYANPKKNGILTPADLGNRIISYSTGAPWNKLYNRQYIIETGLQFQELRNTNDAFFTRVSVVLAKTINFLPDRYVYYRVNNSNSLQGSFKNVDFCYGDALMAIRSELKTRGYWNPEVIESFYNEAAGLTRYYSKKLTTFDQQKQFYMYCKNLFDTLVPEKYERAYISPESIINYWLDDCSFDNYLYQIFSRENQDLKKGLVQANTLICDIQKSRSYKLSLAISYIPRKIKTMFSRQHKKDAS